jgi:predicted transcriptional regulator of viral defense system
LESVEFFDLDKVIEYIQLLENSTTAAKVGFFLEQHREELMVEDHYLKELKDLCPRNPHYLSRTRRESGRIITDWNLVVPEEVLDRLWEEVW